MNKDTLRQVLALAALAVMLVVNVLANALPLNGLRTEAISDRFKVYFTPAGYVFAIWGVIYLGLLGYAVYQAGSRQRYNPRLRSTGLLFMLSCVANAAWIVSWHYLMFPLTLLMTVLLLLCLMGIYLRLRIGRSSPPLLERWTVDVPFSLYLGWATVATIANATVLLDYLGWNGSGIAAERWLMIVLAVALVIATAVTLTRDDWVFPAVFAWAFAGIGIKQMGNAQVAAAAWVAAGYSLALVMITLAGLTRRAASQAT
ncbi:MAG: tryptophan-rich sensory protein [Caldilineales bacterium]